MFKTLFENLWRPRQDPRLAPDEAGGTDRPAVGAIDLADIIFVSGFARGGTTWMRRCLDTHPEIREIPNEISFTKYRPLSREKIEELLAERLSNCDYQIGMRFVTKGPVNSLVLDEMAQLVPEAKFVFILRDPRDVLVSHRKGNQKWMKGKNETVEGCMLKCERYLRHYFKAMDLPNVHLVRYEHLHQGFPLAFKGLCNFLGVEASPGTIDHCMHASSFQSLTGRNHTEENPDAGARKGVVGDWPNNLDKNDLQWLQESSFWKDVFHRFGYRWTVPTLKSLVKSGLDSGYNENPAESGAPWRPEATGTLTIALRVRNAGDIETLGNALGLLQETGARACVLVDHDKLELVPAIAEKFALPIGLYAESQEELELLQDLEPNLFGTYVERTDIGASPQPQAPRLYSASLAADVGEPIVFDVSEGVLTAFGLPENADLTKADTLKSLNGRPMLFVCQSPVDLSDQPLNLGYRSVFQAR